MPTALIALVDAVCIIVFVALGRGSHSEGAAITGTLFVAAPFLIAAALGWFVQVRRWSTALDRRFAIGLWAMTLTFGMALRRTAFDRGVAVAFVIVAALFLALLLIGWRELTRSRVGAAVSSRHD